MTREYQVNNLRIIYSPFYNKWQIRTPSGVVLEEFKLLKDAREWAEKAHDFMQK